MPTGPKKVELWDGKKVVGYLQIRMDLVGKMMAFPISPGVYKEIYGKKYETICVPYLYRCIADDGVDYTIRRCLDVSKKSKRQVAVLLAHHGA